MLEIKGMSTMSDPDAEMLKIVVNQEEAFRRSSDCLGWRGRKV